MICPACHKEMLVMEYRQIELDFCPNSRGLWFDRSELELFMEMSGVSPDVEGEFALEKLLQNTVNLEGLPRRACPICGRKMALVDLGSDRRVIVDICTRHDGIWFDGGELLQLIRRKANASDVSAEVNSVLDYLYDTFKYIN